VHNIQIGLLRVKYIINNQTVTIAIMIRFISVAALQYALFCRTFMASVAVQPFGQDAPDNLEPDLFNRTDA
jgi:hypothetical protein